MLLVIKTSFILIAVQTLEPQGITPQPIHKHVAGAVRHGFHGFMRLLKNGIPNEPWNSCGQTWNASLQIVHCIPLIHQFTRYSLWLTHYSLWFARGMDHFLYNVFVHMSLFLFLFCESRWYIPLPKSSHHPKSGQTVVKERDWWSDPSMNLSGCTFPESRLPVVKSQMTTWGCTIKLKQLWAQYSLLYKP